MPPDNTFARRHRNLNSDRGGGQRPSRSGFAGWRGLALGLLFLCPAAPLNAQLPPANPAELPPLTEARQVLCLSPGDAELHYPVQLQAVVTCFDASAGLFFVQDSTAGIYVYDSHPGLPFKQGGRVEIRGYSGAGLYSPIVMATNILAQGEGKLPAPKVATIDRLAAGVEDSQWVEVEGVVRSEALDGVNLLLDLAADGSRLPARVLDCGPGKPASLIDQRIRVRGVAGTHYNNKRQVTGFHLLVPSLSDITPVEPPLADPYGLAIQPVRSLLTYSPNARYGHRVRVRGIVTFQRPGEEVFLRDATGDLRINSSQATRVEPGDLIDVVGFPALGGQSPVLQDAYFRKVGHEPPPRPIPITAAQAFTGEYDGVLVQTDAHLVDVGETDPERSVLFLRAGPQSFEAFLPKAPQVPHRFSPSPGSLLRLSGICTVETDSKHQIRTWRLWIRSPGDVRLVRRPPDWILARVLWTLALVGLAALVGAAWLTTLKRRLRRETAVLRQQETALEERYRDLFENTSDILFTLDLEGRFASLNLAGEQITGYARAEVLHLPLARLASDREQTRVRQFVDRCRIGPSPQRFELQISAKDGREVILDIHARPDLADGKAVAIRGTAQDITDRKQSEAALRQSEQQLRRFVTEREKLGRDLHDDIIQSIYGAGLGLDDCRRLIQDNPQLAEQRLERSLEGLNGLIRKVRSFIGGLEPADLKGPDFETALQAMALALDPTQSIRILLDVEPAASKLLPDAQAAQLLHIAREAVSNSLRHAQAKSTTVSLRERDGALRLEIRDNGIGFDLPAGSNGGYGLRNMAARAEELGARLEVASQAGRGTRISVEIPRNGKP